MKKMKFFVWVFFIAITSMSFVGCSNDDDPTPEVIDPEATTHYDVWVSIGETSGMGSDETLLVKSLDSLTVQKTVDFQNDGVDVTAKLYQESIIKGQYYYQVPKEKERFGKYQILNNKIITVAEFPFSKNTLKDRRYTHAWIDDKTLVLMAANGKADKVIYIKVDAENMQILEEGELDLPAIPKGDKFSTSGLAIYRQSDGKIIYAFQHKNETNHFYVAFINANTMKVENTVVEDRAEQMAGTAYGELLQKKMFFDANDNLYIACSSALPNATSSTQQFGRLLRINKGATDFDKSYEGYKYDSGKLVTVDYLGGNKVLLYIQDPVHTGAGIWGKGYNSYYAILDLITDKLEELQYEGKVLPYSNGTFSQRSIVLGDKVFIGVNPKNDDPCIYIYDMKNGNVTKGLTINGGYEFNRIVCLDD